MKAPLNIRYVLISDYATVDHTGKLVVAGLYTEDMVVPSVPSILGTFVLTIVAETPAQPLDFVLTVEMPSGKILMGGEGRIASEPGTEGARPRALVGFQFHQVVLPEGGEYKIMLARGENSEDKFEIHRFRVVVNPQAHLEANAPRSQVAAASVQTMPETEGKRSLRR
jgi:hypothetical protein